MQPFRMLIDVGDDSFDCLSHADSPSRAQLKLAGPKYSIV